MSIKSIERAAQACDRAVAQHNADIAKFDNLIDEAKKKKHAADEVVAAPGSIDDADAFSAAITASATAEVSIAKLTECRDALAAKPALAEDAFAALCAAVEGYCAEQEKTKIAPIKRAIAEKIVELRSLSDEVNGLNDAFIVRYGNMAQTPYLHSRTVYNTAYDVAEALEVVLANL